MHTSGRAISAPVLFQRIFADGERASEDRAGKARSRKHRDHDGPLHTRHAGMQDEAASCVDAALRVRL